MAIGGNIEAVLQINIPIYNEIGSMVDSWHDVWSKKGFLDLSAGDSKHTTFDAKIQESTHIFICDYKPIPESLEVEGNFIRVSPENARIVVNSQRYDVMLIDNPINMNKHLEIYLKYTGGQ